MKICIPTADEGGLDARLARHFGKAPYLTMLEVGSERARVVRNPNCHDRRRQCHHVPVLAAHGVDALVSHGLGRRASDSLRAAGISLLEAPEDATVANIAALMMVGDLKPSAGKRTCAHGHQHGEVHSCSGQRHACDCHTSASGGSTGHAEGGCNDGRARKGRCRGHDA